jgi:hypothetical protein
MKLTRRQTLTMGVVAGAAGIGLGLKATTGRGIGAHALAVIREVYGPEFAQQDAALAFARDYEAFVLEKGLSGRAVDLSFRLGFQRLPAVGPRLDRIDDSVIDKFATSTNVILAAERGEPLIFVGLYRPYDTPCQSQLSAQANV